MQLHRVAVAALVSSALAVGWAPSVGAQEDDDLTRLSPEEALERARELQEEFERYRIDHTPIDRGAPQRASCDERIGRICIWFGGEEEDEFPGELREVHEARRQLIRRLEEALEVTRHPWVLGQIVNYLVEDRSLDDAERLADDCVIDQRWWCDALRGYTLHVRTAYVEAEGAFRDALRNMPEDEVAAWTSLRYVVPEDVREKLDALPAEDRQARWELFWRLSDPLFLFEGNDRLTDHFARWVEAYNRRDALDPMGMEWDEDMEATLVRYGRNTGYSRRHDPSRTLSMGGLQDTRQMVGHHHPKSRGYVFPHRFLESPADIPPESWITAPREARTWYAPLYAPEIQGLETQVGRFRRDDAMLVVGAYRPTLEGTEGGGEPVWTADAPPEEPPYAALFLIPVGEGRIMLERARDAEGVLMLEGPPGEYVSSLEVVDLPERRAWRARQGVVQRPLTPGLVSVSDLMLLAEGAPLPDSFDEAVPHVRPGIRVRRGERFGVFWEVYGLRIEEPVRVTLGFSEGRPGFLERVGEFLGILDPEDQVEISFDDVGPDRVQEAFRSVELTMPELDPGEYTLHLRLELPGREPVVTSRPIVVGG